MRRNWMLRELKIAVFAPLFLVVLGFVVMSLWNWLAPAMFGGHTITFWQALGLLVLTRILFGGFRGRRERWPDSASTNALLPW